MTTGPQSTATTPGTLSPDAALKFTAVSGGSTYDNTQIQFVANPSITAGQETVSYDDSNPNSPTLVFQIAQGQTTANDIIAALKNNPTVSQLFTAANVAGERRHGLDQHRRHGNHVRRRAGRSDFGRRPHHARRGARGVQRGGSRQAAGPNLVRRQVDPTDRPDQRQQHVFDFRHQRLPGRTRPGLAGGAGAAGAIQGSALLGGLDTVAAFGPERRRRDFRPGNARYHESQWNFVAGRSVERSHARGRDQRHQCRCRRRDRRASTRPATASN